MAVYPFMEGTNGFHQPLSNQQWVELGKVIKALHSLSVPEGIKHYIPREEFSPRFRDSVQQIMKQLPSLNFPDQVAMEMAHFLQEKEDTIHKLVEKADKLALALKKQTLEYVLCHADLHGANVLIDNKQTLYVIDWDTLIYAPKERDLMFIGGGIGGYWNKREEEEQFYKGYGYTLINADALFYYRYERIIEDIAVFSESLLFTQEGGKDRAWSLEKFKRAFLPDNVVDIAFRETFYQPK